MLQRVTDAPVRPAFADGQFASIGSKGFRAMGHHEKFNFDALQCAEASGATKASSPDLAPSLARAEIVVDSLASLFDDIDDFDLCALPPLPDFGLADESDLQMDALALLFKLDVTGPSDILAAIPALVANEVLPVETFFAAVSPASIMTILSPEILAQIPLVANGALPRIVMALLPPRADSAPKVIFTVLPPG
jgi:hypothetical protein